MTYTYTHTKAEPEELIPINTDVHIIDQRELIAYVGNKVYVFNQPRSRVIPYNHLTILTRAKKEYLPFSYEEYKYSTWINRGYIIYPSKEQYYASN